MPVIRVKTQTEANSEASFWLFALLFGFCAGLAFILGWIQQGFRPDAGWFHYFGALLAGSALILTVIALPILLTIAVARWFARIFRKGKY